MSLNDNGKLNHCPQVSFVVGLFCRLLDSGSNRHVNRDEKALLTHLPTIPTLVALAVGCSVDDNVWEQAVQPIDSRGV